MTVEAVRANRTPSLVRDSDVSVEYYRPLQVMAGIDAEEVTYGRRVMCQDDIVND
jgi:hypothetical protein